METRKKSSIRSPALYVQGKRWVLPKVFELCALCHDRPRSKDQPLPLNREQERLGSTAPNYVIPLLTSPGSHGLQCAFENRVKSQNHSPNLYYCLFSARCCEKTKDNGGSMREERTAYIVGIVCSVRHDQSGVSGTWKPRVRGAV